MEAAKTPFIVGGIISLAALIAVVIVVVVVSRNEQDSDKKPGNQLSSGTNSPDLQFTPPGDPKKKPKEKKEKATGKETKREGKNKKKSPKPKTVANEHPEGNDSTSGPAAQQASSESEVDDSITFQFDESDSTASDTTTTLIKNPFVEQICASKGKEGQLQVIHDLMSTKEPASYEFSILSACEVLLKDEHLFFIEKIARALNSVKFEPAEIAKVVEDLTAFAKHENVELSASSRALYEYWKSVGAFMQLYCKQRTVALDKIYDQVFYSDPGKIQNVYSGLVGFNRQKEMKRILLKSLAFIKSSGLDSYDFAQLFMHIFEKMKGKKMKGLDKGNAKAECYLCVHPKILRRILQQCREKERDAVRQKIILLILQKRLPVSFTYKPESIKISFPDYLDSVKPLEEANFLKVLDVYAMYRVLKQILNDEAEQKPKEKCDQVQLMERFRQFKADPNERKPLIVSAMNYVAEKRKEIKKAMDKEYKSK